MVSFAKSCARSSCCCCDLTAPNASRACARMASVGSGAAAIARSSQRVPWSYWLAGIMHQRHSPHKVSTGSRGAVFIHHLPGHGHELYGLLRGVSGEKLYGLLRGVSGEKREEPRVRKRRDARGPQSGPEVSSDQERRIKAAQHEQGFNQATTVLTSRDRLATTLMNALPPPGKFVSTLR